MKERCGKNIDLNKVWLILAGIMAMVLFFVVELPVEASGQKVVYTSAWDKSNGAPTGDGTKDNPYNRFEDAVANVADGGTIYILSTKSALLNDNGNKPFVINKNVHIKPAPNEQRATLNSRASGIVLGADVVFENIELNFTNLCDQIFANGHSLTLKNITRGSGAKLVDIVAGDFCSASSQAAAGTNARITIQGKCEFGNIYAGSMGGSFWGDTFIKIEDIAANSKLGSIYACGAEEAVSGEFPQPNQAYMVNGAVEVWIDKAPVAVIDGAGALDGTEVICNEEYARSYHSILNIMKLTVQGNLRPEQLKPIPGMDLDLSVPSGGVLNLTDQGDVAVNDFAGGGRLVLNVDATMTIYGAVSGITAFETEKYKGNNTYSGIVTPDHVYIKTNPDSDGTFTFEPYFTQLDLTLQKQSDGGWKIVKASGGETKPPVIDPEEPDPDQPEPEQPDPEEPNPDQSSPGKPNQPDAKPESTTPPVSKPTVTTPPVSPSKPATPSVTKPKPVKISLSKPKVKLKAGKKSAVIKYNKVKNAGGYEIYRSTKKKSGYKKVAVTKKTSYKDKKLKRKKKYYYKVRAYRKVNGKKFYSAYSAVKAVKAK